MVNVYYYRNKVLQLYEEGKNLRYYYYKAIPFLLFVLLMGVGDNMTGFFQIQLTELFLVRKSL